MPADPWLLLKSPPSDAALNMALDEALLEAMPRLGQPILRFYSWTEPAASFGYFQKYVELERLTRLRPLVRRPTGGGLVPHDADWTYSISVPTRHPWYSLSASEGYQRVHQWIRAAFARVGVATELAPTASKIEPGQCFVGHERFDLLWQARKIAGAAQRRRRDGLLIQGSVQPPPALARAAWQSALAEAAATAWAIGWTTFDPDPALASRALALAQAKYSQAAYNQQR